jgi:hypothetical protein
MASTTLTVRGHKIRTQSHFRFQIVRIDNHAARIVGRTDSLASARDRSSRMSGSIVIVDRVTGEEVS